jgi:hypothetical protein
VALFVQGESPGEVALGLEESAEAEVGRGVAGLEPDRLAVRHHLQQCGPELLSGQGVGVVQFRRIDLPQLGNGTDGEVLLEPQPQQLDAPERIGTGLGGAPPLQSGRLGHDRPGPGPVEEAGLTGVIRRDIGRGAGGAGGPALEAAGDVADDAVEEGAEAGHPSGPGRVQDAARRKHSTNTSWTASSRSASSAEPRHRASRYARTTPRYQRASSSRSEGLPAAAARMTVQQVDSGAGMVVARRRGGPDAPGQAHVAGPSLPPAGRR